MSTRSDISILKPDGTVVSQYIHMDGYLAYNGQLLLDNYKTLEDAEKIHQLGDYGIDSSLPDNPKEIMESIKGRSKLPEPDNVKFDNFSQQIESLTRTTTHEEFSGEQVSSLISDVEYHYLFAPNEEGKYQWHTINRDGITPLTQNMIDSEDVGKLKQAVNWSKAPSGKYFDALSEKEKGNLFKSGEQLQQNLEVYDARQLKHARQDEQSKKDDSKTSKQKYDRAAWKKKHDQTVNELKEGLLKEVENYTATPEQMLEFLEFSDKFHQYSARNTMLIHMQRPGATAVGSYAKFKEMGYNVQKGEKGIKMFVPAKTTAFYRKDKEGNDVPTQLRFATKEEKTKIKSGQIDTYSKTVYKIGTVFDATQTDMPKEKYPELYPNRHMDFKTKNPGQLNMLDKGLREVAKDMKMPVITYDSSMKDIPDPQNAKGYFNAQTNQIVLNQYNTPTENITVLAHELGHAQLHNSNKQEKELPRELKEMQAELTSYMYSSHYGIDTKKETVSYIADWTQNGKKFNELPTGVKGQILTHVSSAAKVLTNATDKVMEQEQERIDKVAEQAFLKTPEASQWYEQRKAMENEATDRENGVNVGHSELDKLNEIESKMTPHEFTDLNSKFVETQSWTPESSQSLVSKEVEDKIVKNAAQSTRQVEQEVDQKAQYQQFLAQQGMER